MNDTNMPLIEASPKSDALMMAPLLPSGDVNDSNVPLIEASPKSDALTMAPLLSSGNVNDTKRAFD